MTTTRSASKSRAAARGPGTRRVGRSGGRGRPSPSGASKRRRWIVLLAAVAIGLGGGFVLARLDLGDTLREVTLPLRHDDIVRQQAADKNLDPGLIAAVIYAESRFEDQTSHAGARGLMQVTPETAELIERLSGGSTFVTEDLANPDINIRYGSYYLRYLIDKYGGNEVAALAAYNAGETRVNRWGGSDLEVDDIPFQETHAYVEDVLDKREEYRRHYAEELGLSD